METRARSIAKTFSWRAIATLITSLVAFIMTGELALAVEIGLLDTTAKLAAYYFHERAWLKIDFGRPEEPPPPEYRI